MKKIEDRKEEIAVSFSNGNFETTFPYLSESIVWHIVGENTFKGKPEVVAHCKQTAEYFKMVQTEFITDDVMVTDSKIVVRGSAEFFRNGKQLNHILACDVYEFNNKKLESIHSYCIPIKKRDKMKETNRT
ncbi:hypothetical protein [Flagellimonas sp.]|uniref:hypothetical protein n=1 Tax=Flagellimonas sp. TaxID=2058762 RepID=UPI003BB13BE7